MRQSVRVLTCLFCVIDKKEIRMSKKIFVGNLPHSTSNDQLKEVFEDFGSVSSASVITDRETGRSRGFGFVEMDSDDEAQSAIDGLNGTELEGRPLTVNEAKPRAEGGGNRGGGFRGGPRRDFNKGPKRY